MNTGQYSGTIFRNMKYFNTRILKFILLSTTLVIAWGCRRATKIFSHSYIRNYQDTPMPQSQVSMKRSVGCFGEYDDVHSGRTLTSKAHRVTEECKKNSCKTVVLLRNPYNALLAEAAREFYKSKTTPIEEEFLANISTFFLPRVTSKAKGWLDKNLMYLQYARPLLVVYYEDLQNDPIKEIGKIAKFIGYEVPNLEERLTCLNHDISGPFKRPHSNHGVDPYDKATIMGINQNIKILRDFMQKLKAHNGETLSLPSYERPE